MTRWSIGNQTVGLLALALLQSAATSIAAADPIADTIATCAACHGENGVPVDTMTPVIWGQTRNYILKQLHDFKTGHRKNEVMSGIVEPLSTQDMQALATHFASQKWPAIDAPAPSADSKVTANAVLNQYNCRDCHQEKLEGDYVRPRLAGQQSDYLDKTLKEFRDAHRGNFIAMSSLVRQLSDADVKAVSDYLAAQPSPNAQAGTK